MLAEIHAADQLPHDDEVNALCHDLRLQGAGRGQLGPDLGGAVVGVQAHARAQTQQTLFRALLTGQALPLGAAHGTQQDAVRSKALVQLMLGQRVAVLVNGFAAHGGIGIVEGVAVLFSHLIKHPDGLFHDLGAGAVAPDDSNVFSIVLNSPQQLLTQTLSRLRDSSPSMGSPWHKGELAELSSTPEPPLPGEVAMRQH